jgi:enolase|tara:strand:- start:1471 stop:2628 length:1158 start_codon:yes stop_codon:yes gene_type:complete
MVVIKRVFAKSILDSRKDKTILITIKTNVGNFSASAPNGKSIGRHAVKIYKKNLEEDIKTIKKFSDYFSKEIIEEFNDLRRIEDIVDGHVGANTLFALESTILKAVSKEQKKQIWELINSKSRKIPRLVGNIVGGGKHSNSRKKPDFQEFLIIPNSKSVKESFEKSKEVKKDIKEILKKVDKNFENKKNDEDAWMSSLNEKEILDILKKIKLSIGVDIASSSFYKRNKYNYENPMLRRDNKEQLGYLSNLINNFNLFYIEDPFNEEDFESFSKLLKKFPSSLIVGDDLTVTNTKRFEKAIKMKSINSIIVKPNQIGSLIEVKRVCELARKNNIKIVFSHRSGETEENILADLAFGFESDFFKCGITSKVREIKIKRLIEIEKSLK